MNIWAGAVQLLVERGQLQEHETSSRTCRQAGTGGLWLLVTGGLWLLVTYRVLCFGTGEKLLVCTCGQWYVGQVNSNDLVLVDNGDLVQD